MRIFSNFKQFSGYIKAMIIGALIMDETGLTILYGQFQKVNSDLGTGNGLIGLLKSPGRKPPIPNQMTVMEVMEMVMGNPKISILLQQDPVHPPNLQ